MKYSTAIAFALSATGVFAAPASAPVNGDKPSAQLCQCYTEQVACSTAPYPGGNQAQCSSNFVTCSGVQPYDGSGKTTSVSPTDFFNNLKKNCAAKPSDSKPSEKECKCNAAHSACQTAPYPGGNQAQCASEFVGCSGVQPYEGSGKTTSVSPTDYFNNLDKNCPASSVPAPAASSAPAVKADTGYGSYGTYQNYPSHYASYNKYPSSYASYGSYKKE